VEKLRRTQTATQDQRTDFYLLTDHSKATWQQVAFCFMSLQMHHSMIRDLALNVPEEPYHLIHIGRL
jgi:hypothetical protein